MSAKKPAVLFIFITVLIDSISFGIIIPVFPKLVMTMENCDESQAAVIGGWLVAVFAMAQFVCSPIMGALSDRFGRRPVLLASLFGFGLDFLLLAFAPSLWWLYLGRIIAGIMGASYTTAAAYIADISTDDNKAKNYGMIGAAFGLGFIIGPGVGGLLADFGTRVPFIACACLSLLNWLYGYFVLPESLKMENRRPFSWKRANPVGAFMQLTKYKSIFAMLAAFFLLYLAAQAVMTNWQYYTMLKFGWHEKQIGLSITIVGLLLAFVQGFLVRVVNPKIGNINAVIVGLVLYVIGMLAFGLAPTGLFMYFACIPYCLGGINGPAMQSIMSDSVPKDSQGELQGIITSVQSVTSIIGPVMMAGIFKHFTIVSEVKFPGAAFITGAILIFLALIIAYISLEHRLKRRRTENIMDEPIQS
ncbi:MAG: TCR/Tet family MFS transporter [Flavobacteriales bacterium]